MEKIKISIFRAYLIAIPFAFFIFFIDYFDNFSLEYFYIFLLSIILTMFLVMFISLIKKYKQDGLYFSKDGIILIADNVAHVTPWNNIQPNIKIKIKYFYHITLNLNSDYNRPYAISLFWPTEDDIIEKTKKYCPKNNDLYKIVEEYAKKRNLPF